MLSIGGYTEVVRSLKMTMRSWKLMDRDILLGRGRHTRD